jgi:hypothetical protein
MCALLAFGHTCQERQVNMYATLRSLIVVADQELTSTVKRVTRGDTHTDISSLRELSEAASVG